MHKCVVLLLALFGASSALSQDFPTRPVHMVVPTGVGAGPDLLARTIGHRLAEQWKQPVVIENKPGATGRIGTDYVAKSPPDGYSLVIVPNSYASNPALFHPFPFDPIKDLTPVVQVALGGMVLVVNPAVPVNTVGDLLEMAKKQPGHVLYGSPGSGSTHHMMMELFKHVAGVDLMHVPYKVPPAVTAAVLSNEVPTAFITIQAALPHVRAGKLRALAVAGDRRFGVAADIPTVAETGLKAFDPNLWYGILAPAGTPREIVRKINVDVAAILAMPQVRESLKGQGLEPAPTTAERFAEIIRLDIARYTKLVKDTGIKAD